MSAGSGWRYRRVFCRTWLSSGWVPGTRALGSGRWRIGYPAGESMISRAARTGRVSDMAGVRESEGWCIRRRVWPAMRRARRWRTRGLIAPVNPSLRNPGAIHIVADFRRWLCQSRGAGSARRTWPGALKRDRRRGTGCPGWAVEAFPHVGPGGHRQQWWLAWLVSPARRSRRRTTRRLGSRDATRPAPRADIYLEHNKRRWQPETAN